MLITKKELTMKKYLVLLLISANAFGFTSAAEAHKISSREAKVVERACVASFKINAEDGITRAASRGSYSFSTDDFDCLSGLPAFVAKLRKLGYTVETAQDLLDLRYKFLQISW